MPSKFPHWAITGGEGKLATALGQYLHYRGINHTRVKKGHWLPLDASLVINCAAVVSPKSETNRTEAWNVNVELATQYAAWCKQLGIRFVHISTDSVYSGEKGMYTETDIPDPIGFTYGITKAAGESAVLAANPYALVLRAPFRYDGPWRYPKAFTDAYRSSVWMSQVIPEIVKAATVIDLEWFLHIAGPRRSVYDMAVESNPSVEPCLLSDFKDFPVPRDISLDGTRWQNIKLELGIS